jgi:hypothetical protein
MLAVFGGRAFRAVAVALLCALLGPTASACTAARPGSLARAGVAASRPPVTAPLPSPGLLDSVASVPPGTAIAPGATAVAGASAGVFRARLPVADRTPLVGTLRVLQLNLCDSGEAGCYTGGRSVDEATGLVRGAAKPDLVTLNEVCGRDVTDRLGGVMAELWPADDVVYLFAPALNAAGTAYRCQNGDVFGNAVVARVPAGQVAVLDTRYGVYAAQATDIEQRTFGCLRLAPQLAACVTHLESLSPDIAAAQCATLMTGVVPALRHAWGAAISVVTAGDLNLADAVRSCTPAGFGTVGDGLVQHVLGSEGVRFQRVDRYPMHETDHDALLVSLALP